MNLYERNQKQRTFFNEKIDSYGSVIFWSAPVETFSKTRWSKVVGSNVYDQITIRNANTVKKVLEIGNK